MSVDIKYNISREKPAIETFAVVYARYSSHNQGEQSIEGQLSEAYKYAASHGYKIIHEYVDRAKTGRTDSRDEFQRMLRDTAKKQFSVIILWKVDRFGRNREEIAVNKMRCKKNGVRVEYIAETIPDAPEGVILESVLEGFAEYYSLQLSQNVRRGQNESAEKCQSTGGNRPLGYLTGPDKKFIIDPDTAPTVKLIFDMYAAGHTVTEIVKHLNDLGLHTFRSSKFTKNSLHSILKNEKYTGVYIYRDIRIEGGMPRIIDDETFQKVQEMLKVNKRAPASKWSKSEYLLTDKAFCGKCGMPMVGESGTSKTGAKHNYYICSKKKRFRQCDKKAIRQNDLEQLVIQKALEVLQDDELLEFIIENTWNFYQAQDESQEEIKALQKQLQQAETGIANLVRAVEAGIINEATKKRMDELTEQKSNLLAAIAEREVAKSFHITRDHIAFFLYKLRDLDSKQKESQKRIIQVFINSVYVFDDEITINFNYTSGNVTMPLKTIKDSKTGKEFVHRASCSANRAGFLTCPFFAPKTSKSP